MYYVNTNFYFVWINRDIRAWEDMRDGESLMTSYSFLGELTTIVILIISESQDSWTPLYTFRGIFPLIKKIRLNHIDAKKLSYLSFLIHQLFELKDNPNEHGIKINGVIFKEKEQTASTCAFRNRRFVFGSTSRPSRVLLSVLLLCLSACLEGTLAVYHPASSTTDTAALWDWETQHQRHRAGRGQPRDADGEMKHLRDSELYLGL